MSTEQKQIPESGNVQQGQRAAKTEILNQARQDQIEANEKTTLQIVSGDQESLIDKAKEIKQTVNLGSQKKQEKESSGKQLPQSTDFQKFEAYNSEESEESGENKDYQKQQLKNEKEPFKQDEQIDRKEEKEIQDQKINSKQEQKQTQVAKQQVLENKQIQQPIKEQKANIAISTEQNKIQNQVKPQNKPQGIKESVPQKLPENTDIKLASKISQSDDSNINKPKLQKKIQNIQISSPSKIQKTTSAKSFESDQLKSDKSIDNAEVKTNQFPTSVIMKQAEKQRILSIYQTFRKYYQSFQDAVSSYKLIIKNVCFQLQSKKTSKAHLQKLLIQYFESYSKIHRQFDHKAFKISKTEVVGSANMYINMKEALKAGFQGLNQVRKSVAVSTQKLDSYINVYIIKSIKQAFQDYEAEINAQDRNHLATREEFFKYQKQFKKLIEGLDKLCKKGMEGVKTKQDIFMELVTFINKQTKYKQLLIKYGKTTIFIRKNFIHAEHHLFEKLQSLMNQFKNQQRSVYTAAKQFNLIENFTPQIEENLKFQHLCTITDVDYIRGVLELQNRQKRIAFENKHFEQYLQMPYYQKIIGKSTNLLKGAIKKTFPFNKDGIEIIHTISQNLIQFDRTNNECKQKFVIQNINANVIGEGAIEFNELLGGIIFKQYRTLRIQLQSADRAEQLISYLNEMGSMRKQVNQK